MCCFKKIQIKRFGGLVFLGSLVFLLFFVFFTYSLADDLSSSAVDYVCFQSSQDVTITPCLPGGWLSGAIKRFGCGNPVSLKANTYYRIGAKDYLLTSVNCGGYEEINKKAADTFFLEGKARDRLFCNWSHECMKLVSSQVLTRSVTNNFCRYNSDGKHTKEQITYFVIEGVKQCSYTK